MEGRNGGDQFKINIEKTKYMVTRKEENRLNQENINLDV